MRKIVLWMAGLFLVISGYSQVTSDIGIWGGASGYAGDMQGTTLTQFSFPAFGAFFRYNFHKRIGARLMFLTGPVAADGLVNEYNWSFDKGVQELTMQAEINYLDYILGHRKSSFTSYLTAGIGVMYYNYERYPQLLTMINPRHRPVDPGSESAITPTLPFGIGFKYNIGKRVGMGVEYQMRKLFDDRLDDLDDPMSYVSEEGKEITYTDFFHNNDWTGFLGVFLTFKIYMGKKACPAYDSKN